ncbi:MAG: hypothetical protein L3J54_08425 [Draconibacterium sp.]|nr:hypothetical protein [Draconibacterium sp.]
MQKLFYLFSIVLVIFSTSCTPTKTIVDTSCSGYKNADFDRTRISSSGIGVMPILGGNNKEQFRRPMGDAITKYLRLEFNKDNVLSPNQVISTINEMNLSDKYSIALNNYIVSGIVPKDMVNTLGDALSVDYLLYTRLLTDSEIGYVASGYGIQAISIDEIYVQCQIWDTRVGDVIWEGKGGIAKLDQNVSNIVEKTAKGLAKVIGQEASFGPCEDRQELVKSVQEASTNTYLAASGVSLVLLLLILVAL